MYLSKSRKTKWTTEEDAALRVAVSHYPYRKGSFAVDWKAVSKVCGRTTKQCRERWINVLDPSIRRDTWTFDEIRMLFEAQEELGNKWAAIALRLPGRPETAVKNTFYAAIRREQRRSWSLKHGQPVPEPFHPAVPHIASVRRLLASMGEYVVVEPSDYSVPPSPVASVASSSRKRPSTGKSCPPSPAYSFYDCAVGPMTPAPEISSLDECDEEDGDDRPRKISAVGGDDDGLGDVFSTVVPDLAQLGLGRNKSSSISDADSESLLSDGEQDSEHDASPVASHPGVTMLSGPPAGISGHPFDFPLVDPLDLCLGLNVKFEQLPEPAGLTTPAHMAAGDAEYGASLHACFDALTALTDDDFSWLQ